MEEANVVCVLSPFVSAMFIKVQVLSQELKQVASNDHKHLVQLAL